MRSNFVLCCSLLLLAIQCLAVTHTPNWAKYHEAELKPGAEGSLVVSTHKAGSGITMPLDVKENVKVTYTMEVRGEGQVSPYLSGGHGWYYGKKVALDSQNWTKVSITYATHYHKVTLMLVSAASEATFEVRNLQVDEAKPDELTEADMPPQLFCATDFPGSNGVSKKIQGALNGNAIWGKRWYNLCRLPVPANSKPLFYYVHVKRTGEKGFSMQLLSYPSTYPASTKSNVPSSDGWNWIKIGPVDARLPQSQVYLNCTGDPNVECLVDKIIITTQDQLDNATLDNVKPLGKMADMQSGFVCIGKGTPVIDGKLEDEAWENSIELTNFLINGTSQNANEQTSVRLLWDDENIYVSFHCKEKVLNPYEDRLGDFQRKYAKHDSSDAIYKDDCVEFLLFNPKTKGKVYDIIMSASGVFNDSLDTYDAQEFWTKRDFSWESDAKTAVYVNTEANNGYWNVEIAMPWSKLGGKPEGNEPWRMTAARFEKAFKETSAYQIVPQGIHIIDTLSDIYFIESVPGIKVEKMPDFVPGPNKITASVKTDAPLTMFTQINFSKNVFNEETFISKNNTKAEHDFKLMNNGAFRFSWGLRGSADMREYYRSPMYKKEIVTTFLEANLDKASLKLNGAAIKGKAMLHSGLNTLTIDAKEGAKVSLAAFGYEIPFPAGWLKDPKSSTHTLKLYLDTTEVWPNWRHEGISIIKGKIQQIILVPKGFPGVVLNDYTLYLDLPEGISFLGASGYYKHYQLESREIGKVNYGKKTLRRYAIRVLKSIPIGKTIEGHQMIVAVVSASANFKGDETELYFHAGSAEHGIAELPSKINVHLLPETKGKQPKFPLRIQMWSGWLQNLDDRELLKTTYRYMADMGINEATRVPEKGKVPEVKEFALFNFASWNFDIAPYLAQHPEQRRINEKGKVVATEICSTAYLEDKRFKDYLSGGLKDWHQRQHKPSHANWDYESRALSSYLACYCPICLKKFASQENVPEQGLTPEKIKASYKKQWIHYITKRMADISGLHREIFHRELPGVTYSVYSAYQSEGAKEHYGIDWNMLADKTDLAMTGYGRKEDDLLATRAALKKTPWVIGIVCYPYDFSSRIAPYFINKAWLLRSVADGTAGVLIYNFPTLDGRSFASFAAVSRIMAEHHDFFVSGIRANELLTIRGFGSSEYEVLGDGRGNYLIAIMSFAKAPRSFKATFKLPAGKKLYEYGTDKEVQSEFSGNISPNDIAVYFTK